MTFFIVFTSRQYWWESQKFRL